MTAFGAKPETEIKTYYFGSICHVVHNRTVAIDFLQRIV